MVKNLPAKQQTEVWSLGRKDPLDKEKATHSSILVWKIPQTEEPGGPQSVGSQSCTQLSTPRVRWRTDSALRIVFAIRQMLSLA